MAETNNKVQINVDFNGAKAMQEIDKLKASMAKMEKATQDSKKSISQLNKLAFKPNIKPMKDVTNLVSTNTGKIKQNIAAQKQLNTTQATTASVGGKLKSVLARVGVGFAVGGAIMAANAEMRAYQQNMSKVTTLLNGNEKAFVNAKKGINEMSTATGIARSEIADGYYEALSSGIKVTDDMAGANEQVAIAMKLAKGGFTDSQTAVDGLTTVLNAYQMSADQTTRVSDIMIKTQDLGKVTVDEMAKTLGNIIPVAADANVSFEQIGAAYSVLTAQGMPANKTSTAMRNIIVELNNKASKMGKTFETAAGKSFQQFIKEGGNVQQAVSMVKKEAEKTKTPIGKLVGKETISAFNMLTNAGEDFNNALITMDTSAGATDENFAKATNNLNDNLNKTKETILGGLMPALDAGSGLLNSFVGGFANLSNADKNLVMVGTAAVGATGGITKFISSLGDLTAAEKLASTGIATFGSSLLTLVTNPAFIAIAAIGAIGAALYKLHSDQQEATKSVREYGQVFAESYNNIDISSSQYAERMTGYNKKMQEDIESTTLSLYQMRAAVDGKEYKELSNNAKSSMTSLQNSLKQATNYHNSELSKAFANIEGLDDKTKKKLLKNAQERGKTTIEEANKEIDAIQKNEKRKIELLSMDNRSKKNQQELDKILQQEQAHIQKLAQLKEQTVLDEQNAQTKIMNEKSKAGLLTKEQIDAEVDRRKEAAAKNIENNNKTTGSQLAALEKEQQAYKTNSDQWQQLETSKNNLIQESNKKHAEYTTNAIKDVASLHNAKIEDLNFTTDSNGKLQSSYAGLSDTQKEAAKQVTEFYNQQPPALQKSMTEMLGIQQQTNTSMQENQQTTAQKMNENPLYNTELMQQQASQAGQGAAQSFSDSSLAGFLGNTVQMQNQIQQNMNPDTGVITQQGQQAGADSANATAQGYLSNKGQIDNAKNQANATPPKANGNDYKAGADRASQYAKGIQSGKGQVQIAINTITNVKATSSTNGNAIGSKIAQGVATGISSGQGNVQSAINSLVNVQALNKAGEAQAQGSATAQGFVSGFSSVDVSSVGSNLANNAINGLNSQSGAFSAAGTSLATQAKSGLSSGSSGASAIGSYFGSGFVSGIGAWIGAAYSKGMDIGKSAIKGVEDSGVVKSPSREMRKVGSFYGEGHVLGMQDWLGSSYDVGFSLGTRTMDGVKQAGDVHSPAKKMKQVGRYYGLGFGLGLGATQKQLVKKSKQMARAVINTWKQAINDANLEKIMSYNSVAQLQQDKAGSLRKARNKAERQAIIKYYDELIKEEKRASAFRQKELKAEKKKTDAVNKAEKKIDDLKEKLETKSFKKMSKAKQKAERKRINKLIDEQEKKIRLAEQKYEISMSKIDDDRESYNRKKEAQEKLEELRKEAEEKAEDAKDEAERKRQEAKEKAAEAEAKRLEEALKKRGLISPSIETGSSRIVNIQSPMHFNFNFEEIKNYDQFKYDLQRFIQVDLVDKLMGGKFI